MKIGLQHTPVRVGILLDPSPSSALHLGFITFLSVICQAALGCSSAIIGRVNWEMVLSKRLENVSFIGSYRYQYITHISLPTANLLILYG